SPSWSVASRPSALASNEVIRRTNLGWQFKSSLTNGLLYDSRDNVYNTTQGLSMDLSVETVGQILGGQDHYNQYTAKFAYYYWPFDYTFGGLFRSNALKRWRVVIEARVSGTFTHETAPYNGSQNKDINPYIEPGDKLYIGGYETLRGYDYARDSNFPQPWWQLGGANHMLLGGLELRLPIEPSVLWWSFFLDAGSMFVNLGELTGDYKDYVDDYDDNVRAQFEGSSALDVYLADRINPVNQKPNFYGSRSGWNDPRRAVLSQRNLALDRTLFSWGFGIRIQIPVLPLRLFLAQKLHYADGKLKPIAGDDKFQFVFGIGDFRY
ncbi:MAG: BamA/TamA family outer membrane protein, partial [Leptospiraceae bacterium]|nr:BamA/TamA family outer membrane protein [Leptospiraceae bacterium]